MTEQLQGIGFIPEGSDYDGRMPVPRAPELRAAQLRRLRLLRRLIVVGLAAVFVLIAVTMSLKLAAVWLVGLAMGWPLGWGDGLGFAGKLAEEAER